MKEVPSRSARRQTTPWKAPRWPSALIPAPRRPRPLDDVRADDLLLHELELPWGAVADVVIGELTLSLRDARVVALSARTVPPRRYHTEFCAAKHFNQKRGPAVAYALRSAWFEAMPSLVR